MGAKLTATRNYGLFELTEFNRDVVKTSALEKSMKTHGFLPAYPLHVIRNGNGKLKIKAGHHRFTVARKLNLPVFYVLCEDIATVHELETSTVPWKLNDYLVSFCRCENKQEYQYVADYIKRTGISIKMSVRMMAGNTSSNADAQFKAGAFAIRDARHAEIVGDIVIRCKEKGMAWSNHGLFVTALSRVARLAEFDGNQFVRRVEANPALCVKQGTLAGYMDMIERIYNHKSHEKVPLVFLADEAARQRMPEHIRKSR